MSARSDYVLKTAFRFITNLNPNAIQRISTDRRKKIENLIIEYVHKRAILRNLIKSKVRFIPGPTESFSSNLDIFIENFTSNFSILNI